MRPRVSFGEIAEAGLRQIASDDSRRHSLRRSIEWYLRRVPRRAAARCPTFAGRTLWVYKLGGRRDIRILFEDSNGDVHVWSVAYG